MSSLAHASAPLRVQAFRNLWIAATVSNVGSFLQTVAASWLMLELTGSATWVALMVASTTLPLLVIALPAGALADLVDRRVMLVGAQLVMAAAALGMAALSWAGLVSPGRLLALGLLLGAGFAFNLPAWQALVPDLVPRDLVPGAVALNSASFNVARAVGPALGGVLVATAGPGWAFALNAASYLAVIAALLVYRAAAPRRRPAAQETSVPSAIALGLRYARFTPLVGRLLLVAAAFALTSAVLQATLPNLTQDTLGGDARTLGLLLGAMGLGALAGAFSRPAVGERLGAAMVPAAIVAFGVCGVLVGLARAVPVAALGMALAGAAWVWTLSTLNATTQLLAPSWVRGRIMSLYTLAFLGFLPLGSILAGLAADAVGVPTAVVALSAATVVVGLVSARLHLPVLGEVAAEGAALEPVRPRDLSPHPAAVEGGPVTVQTTWVIDDADLEAFLDVMSEVRLIRLRTGASRWRLYRDVVDPHRMTELLVLPTWDRHLSQLAHMDRGGLETVRRARAFDRTDGGPVTSHLAAIDVRDVRPGWDQLAAVASDASEAV